MKTIAALASLLFLLQESGTAPVAAQRIKGADIELLSEVRRVGEHVERLRQDTFERPPLAVRAPDEMRQVAATIRAYNVLPRKRLDARGRAWTDLGLGGENAPRDLLTTLAADLVGIGFDPEGNRLLVEPGRLSAADFFPEDEGGKEASTILLMTGVRPDEPLVSHMLMHLRQRERSGADPLQPTTDGLLAAAAWAEGEANLVAIQYLFEGMDLSEEIFDTTLDPGDVLEGALLPSGLLDLKGAEGELARFVYLDGFDRVVQHYRAGGWDQLGQVISGQKLTRDLLHPDRTPKPVAEFDDPAPPREGLTLADRDSLGEQAIVVLVSTLTGKDNLGLVAGDGWNGDVVYRWESPNGASVTDWHTRWTNERAVADFDYAVGRCFEARFPGVAWQQHEGGSRSVVAGGRRFRFERDGLSARLTVDSAP